MESALPQLVEELTTSGDPEPPTAAMTALKRICRSSEEQLGRAYHLLRAQLSQDHAQVRLSAFQAMEQLFTRSHCFRTLLVSDFQEFLELTVGTNHEQPLPPPREVAQRLRQATLRAVQGWVAKYGQAYKKLELGFHFLQHNKQVDFQDLDARTPVERKRAEERQQRLERIYKERAEQATRDMGEMLEEIQRCLKEVDSCFCLLVPFDLAMAPVGAPDPEDEEQPCCSKSLPAHTQGQPTGPPQEVSEPLWEKEYGDEDKDSFLRAHGLSSRGYSLQLDLSADSLRVQEDEDNQAVVHSARDALKLIQNKFLPTVTSWVQLFTRAGVQGGRLEDAINLKMALEAALRRGREMVLQPDGLRELETGVSEDEDDDFVEVPEKEGYEPCIPAHLRSECGLEEECTAQDSQSRLQARRAEEAQDPTSAAAQPHTLRGRVPASARAARDLKVGGPAGEQARAPVVPFGLDLCYWGQEPPLERILRANSEHRFWRPLEVDVEAEVDAEVGLEPPGSRHITFAGTFQPVLHYCHAPRPDGRLCKRQDRLKCPFHGKIIPRDEAGQPLNPEDRAREWQQQERRQAERPDWKDSEFLKDVEAATGVDLGSAQGRGQGRGRRRKHPGLADLRRQADTSRARLAKKVFNKASVQRVAAAMNRVDQRKHEKFQNQFNYALH